MPGHNENCMDSGDPKLTSKGIKSKSIFDKYKQRQESQH